MLDLSNDKVDTISNNDLDSLLEASKTEVLKELQAVFQSSGEIIVRNLIYYNQYNPYCLNNLIEMLDLSNGKVDTISNKNVDSLLEEASKIEVPKELQAVFQSSSAEDNSTKFN